MNRTPVLLPETFSPAPSHRPIPARSEGLATRRESPWSRWLTISGLAARGYGVSLLMHLAVIVVMSLIILDHVTQNPLAMSLSMSEGDRPGVEFDDQIDTRIAQGNDQPLLLEMPKLETASSIRPQFARSPAAAGGPTGDPNGNPESGFSDGFQFAMPRGGGAVIKGNFAAWTVPTDPAPGETYKIIIQIRLPEHVRTYPLNDLSGMVEGTDLYRQTIPTTVRGTLPVKNHQTQLVIDVPGATALVKDIIVIRSRVLNEKQELEIVF